MNMHLPSRSNITYSTFAAGVDMMSFSSSTVVHRSHLFQNSKSLVETLLTDNKQKLFDLFYLARMDIFNRPPSIAEDTLQYALYPSQDVAKDRATVTSLAALLE